jgi:hypothetical protein
MLKRLLVAGAVVASTLVISGPITTQPAIASDCTSIGESPAPVGTAAKKCRWQQRYGNWCKFCYKYGKWRMQYCRDMDEDMRGQRQG